jgi:NADH:ubiquinone oxidoreductase subunit F (NADH-binding)
MSVVEGQGAYICGEETALIASIEGRRAEVDVRPPFPTVEGLYKKPTVVNNVESLAAVATIFKLGSEAFKNIGNGKSTGTKLISLDGYFNNPGLYEVDMAASMEFIIDEIGNGFNEDIKAIQVGGPLGGIVPIDILRTLTLDFESFDEGGFLLGHASFVCIPKSFSAVEYAKHLFAFTAHESCGKCFPCRLGSTRGKEMLESAIYKDTKFSKELMHDLLETMESGSLCALGGGLPLPIKNLLEHCSEEFETLMER